VQPTPVLVLQPVGPPKVSEVIVICPTASVWIKFGPPATAGRMLMSKAKPADTIVSDFFTLIFDDSITLSSLNRAFSERLPALIQ
jgi:hypothetical protein